MTTWQLHSRFAKYLVSTLLLTLFLGGTMSGMINVPPVQAAEPVTRVRLVDPYPSIVLGETARIVVEATNLGGFSEEGDFSVSFPDNPSSSILCNPLCETDTSSGYGIYRSGDQLYCCYGSGQMVTATYPLVNAVHVQWGEGVTKTLRIDVTPRGTDLRPDHTLWLYTKFTMRPGSGSGSWVGDPPASCPTCDVDQQVEKVYWSSLTVYDAYLYLSSTTTDGRGNVGSIEFDSATYNLPRDQRVMRGDHRIRANPPPGYQFKEWRTGGENSISCISCSETTLSITPVSGHVSMSSLHAVFEPQTVSVTVRVLQPNGGEVWQAGAYHAITWQVSGAANHQTDVFWSPNGPNPLYWTSITGCKNLPQTYSSCPWFVPALPTTNAYVNVTVRDTTTGVWSSDISDHSFTIDATFQLGLFSRVDAGPQNIGNVAIDGAPHSLPAAISIVAGDYEVAANPPAGYSFDHWESTGYVWVPPNCGDCRTTSLTVQGNGNLTAVLRPASGPRLRLANVYVNALTIGGSSHIFLAIRNEGETSSPARAIDVPYSFFNTPEGFWEEFEKRSFGWTIIQGGSASLQVPELAPGAETRVSFVVHPDQNAKPSFIFVNTVKVSFLGETVSTHIDPFNQIEYDIGVTHECVLVGIQLLLHHVVTPYMEAQFTEDAPKGTVFLDLKSGQLMADIWEYAIGAGPYKGMERTPEGVADRIAAALFSVHQNALRQNAPKTDIWGFMFNELQRFLAGASFDDIYPCLGPIMRGIGIAALLAAIGFDYLARIVRSGIVSIGDGLNWLHQRLEEASSWVSQKVDWLGDRFNDAKQTIVGLIEPLWQRELNLLATTESGSVGRLADGTVVLTATGSVYTGIYDGFQAIILPGSVRFSLTIDASLAQADVEQYRLWVAAPLNATRFVTSSVESSIGKRQSHTYGIAVEGSGITIARNFWEQYGTLVIAGSIVLAAIIIASALLLHLRRIRGFGTRTQPEDQRTLQL